VLGVSRYLRLIVRLLGFFAIAALLLALPSVNQSAAANPQHHWRDTATEEISTERYSNCDYGYYVDLPHGVVAHGSKPPSPNHGMIIDLIEPTSTTEALGKNLRRYISVGNSYNAAGLPSLAAVVDDNLKSFEQDKSDFHVIERVPTRLDGLDASLLRLRYEEGANRIFGELVISYRRPGPKALGNIVYEFQLITPEDTYSQDSKTFDKLLSGFHLTRLTVGTCSNG
jgi:hypothetical protein